MARKDRFLVALGVKCTLTDGLWNNIHGFNNLRSRTGQLLPLKLHEIKARQAMHATLLRELQKATDEVPHYGWMTYM